MLTRIPFAPCVLVALLLAVAAPTLPARGEESEIPEELVHLRLPLGHLAMRPDVRLDEGPRSLRDVFPYVRIREDDAAREAGGALTPGSLARVLAASPAVEGEPPSHVRSAEGALEAVRLFVAGPLVRSEAEGARLIAAGRALGSALEHLSVKVTDHRPARWAPEAVALPQERSIRRTEAWRVSLVALEVDRKVQLVHVEATVRADGHVQLERKAIVEGPPTTWQTEGAGAWTKDDERRQQAMRREVVEARRRYAEALGKRRDTGDVWALARIVHDRPTLELFLGAPERIVGSGLLIPAYELDDGTVALFATAGGPGPVIYARRVERVESTLRWGPTMETWVLRQP